MNTGNFTFLCRTKIGFGMNGLEHLPFDLFSMGSQKPLVLLDKDAHLGGCTRPLIRAFKESNMTLGLCPPLHGNLDADQETDFLKTVYTLYKDNGFDAIIALGTGTVVDLAKALNVAVNLGPSALKTVDQIRITQPLAPFAFIPTGMGTGRETDTTARFKGTGFSSPFLAPDLAIIDPQILTRDTPDTLVNASLTCLSACCEAHVLSGNPPARAYCATGIELIMENFLPLTTQLMASEAAPGKKSAQKSDPKTTRRQQARLAHATVITGIILANCKKLYSVQLGERLANHCSISPGQAMGILVPSVLDLLANNSPELASLALALAGPDEFSSIPKPQRPGAAIQKFQSLLNELYRIFLGNTPRTLADIRLDKQTRSGLAQTLLSHPDFPEADSQGIDPEKAQTILTHALEGLSHTTNSLNPA